jgi:hypothetical protein
VALLLQKNWLGFYAAGVFLIIMPLTLRVRQYGVMSVLPCCFCSSAALAAIQANMLVVYFFGNHFFVWEIIRLSFCW